ncbi:MAG: RDD family protein [Rickettsiaceae bacterium]
MKKQIVYCKFVPRVFAMTIDLIVLSIIMTPIMNVISQYIFLHLFQDFFVTHSVDMSDKMAVSAVIRTQEFASYATANKFFTYFGLVFTLNTLFMGAYFVFFWRKFNATPGKMIMRMRVVDADDFSTPSTYRLIKRFVSYVTALIGIWSIIFNKRGMSLHDKIANTVVIKS